MPAVVDENVLVVANDLSRLSRGLEPLCPEASEECRIACAEELYRLVEKGNVVLDGGSEYFDKYRAHCSLQGQPGVGDTFLRSVFERGYTPWATRVAIRDEQGNYTIPQEIMDSSFDRDDLPWLAGCHRGPPRTSLINAVDSDYAEHADLLRKHKIVVREVCSA